MTNKKKQKIEINKIQALAAAQNEVRVQVLIQLLHCMQPIKLQMNPRIQVHSSLLPSQPLQMFLSPNNRVQPITGTQKTSATMVHPVPMRGQDRREAEIFEPQLIKMQPSTSTGNCFSSNDSTSAHASTAR